MLRAGGMYRFNSHQPFLCTADSAVKVKQANGYYPFVNSTKRGSDGFLEGDAGQHHFGFQPHHPIRHLRMVEKKIIDER
jgi:hypothetical protein